VPEGRLEGGAQGRVRRARSGACRRRRVRRWWWHDVACAATIQGGAVGVSFPPSTAVTCRRPASGLRRCL
jgi:hypothetical protein